jgi:heme exporter protein D
VVATSEPAAVVAIVVVVVVVVMNVKLMLNTIMVANVRPVRLTKAQQSRSYSDVISNDFDVLLPV